MLQPMGSQRVRRDLATEQITTAAVMWEMSDQLLGYIGLVCKNQ